MVLVNPGDTATLISQPAGSAHAVALAGRHIVIDGLARGVSRARRRANTMWRSAAVTTRCSTWSSTRR